MEFWLKKNSNKTEGTMLGLIVCSLDYKVNWTILVVCMRESLRVGCQKSPIWDYSVCVLHLMLHSSLLIYLMYQSGKLNWSKKFC